MIPKETKTKDSFDLRWRLCSATLSCLIYCKKQRVTLKSQWYHEPHTSTAPCLSLSPSFLCDWFKMDIYFLTAVSCPSLDASSAFERLLLWFCCCQRGGVWDIPGRATLWCGVAGGGSGGARWCTEAEAQCRVCLSIGLPGPYWKLCPSRTPNTSS